MIISGNWKTYVESAADAKKLYAAAKKLGSTKTRIVVAPPTPFIGLLASAGKSKVAIAAQDVSSFTDSPVTGEVTASMLSKSGVTHVIVGHSERRAHGDTDAIVSEKVRRALAHGLIPVVCVGELERDTEAHYLKEVRSQLAAVMTPLSQKERLSLIIAYEPVWAIGKSSLEAITSADLAEMVLYIRKVLGDFLPGKSAQRIPIIYGGSVDPTNIRDLAAGTGVEGFLPGRASTNASTFSALVKALS
jgi:triosephosphate isomerase (TIM)